MQLGDVSIKRGLIATVVDDVVRQRQPLSPAGLLRQHASGQRFIDTVALYQSA